MDEVLAGTSTIGIAAVWNYAYEDTVARDITTHAGSVFMYGDRKNGQRVGLVIGEPGNGGEDAGEIVIPDAKIIYIWTV